MRVAPAGPEGWFIPMIVQDGMCVGIDYTLRLDSGEVIDSSEGRGPLEFAPCQNAVGEGMPAARGGSGHREISEGLSGEPGRSAAYSTGLAAGSAPSPRNRSGRGCPCHHAGRSPGTVPASGTVPFRYAPKPSLPWGRRSLRSNAPSPGLRQGFLCASTPPHDHHGREPGDGGNEPHPTPTPPTVERTAARMFIPPAAIAVRRVRGGTGSRVRRPRRSRGSRSRAAGRCGGPGRRGPARRRSPPPRPARRPRRD